MTSRPGAAVSGLAFVDVGDGSLAQRPAALGQRLQHFGEREHARQATVVHDDQRSDVMLRHHFDRFEHRTLGRRREERVALDPQDFTDQHGSFHSHRTGATSVLPERQGWQPTWRSGKNDPAAAWDGALPRLRLRRTFPILDPTARSAPHWVVWKTCPSMRKSARWRAIRLEDRILIFEAIHLEENTWMKPRS